LRIINVESAQRWERDFEGHQLSTLQWADPKGRLVERFGAWEFFFELQVQDAALCYVQCAARLRIGPLGISVPLAIAPRVTARVTCDHPTRVNVSVTVTLPGMGLLIAYDGQIDSGGRTE
jgi:hypothetical protein